MLGKKIPPSNWEEILEEYSQLVATDKSTGVFELLKKINYNAAKLTFVNEAVKFMKKYGYDAEFADYLVQYGFDFIEPSEGEQLWKQILLVESEAKSIIVMLNQYNVEYRKLVPEADLNNTEKLEEMDYLKELAILSKFIGYHIKPEETYVTEFAAIVNTYIEYNKERKHGFSNDAI